MTGQERRFRGKPQARARTAEAYVYRGSRVRITTDLHVTKVRGKVTSSLLPGSMVHYTKGSQWRYYHLRRHRIISCCRAGDSHRHLKTSHVWFHACTTGCCHPWSWERLNWPGLD